MVATGGCGGVTQAGCPIRVTQAQGCYPAPIGNAKRCEGFKSFDRDFVTAPMAEKMFH